jgi:pyruvate dehydrogenase E1 component alpha subunit
MHIVDFEAGMLGTNGIVGGGIPIATGAGFANSWHQNGKVAVAFFGDGAANQGVLFESLNLAALWQLPVLYVCENNQYTEWSRTEALTSGSIPARATPFGIPSVSVDGNDVEAVREATLDAAARARRGDGPGFIEAITYRWYGHNEGEEAFSGRYRSQDEVAEWKSRDPISLFRDRLIEERVIDARRFDEMTNEVIAEVNDAYEYGNASPVPDTSTALTDVFAPSGEK